MKKIVLGILLCVLGAMIVLTGCKKKNNKKAEIYVIPYEYDMVLGEGICMSPHMEVMVLSDKELDKKKIKVELDTDLEYTTDVSTSKDVSISKKLTDIYKKEGKKLKEKLYMYHVYTIFDLYNNDIIEDSYVKNIEVTYEGQKYNAKINGINFEPSIIKVTSKEQSDAFNFTSLAAGPIEIKPSKDGVFEVAATSEYKATKDVIIKDIKILNNDSVIKKVIIYNDQTENETIYTKDFEIKKGTTGKIGLVLEDKDFANKALYESYVHACIEYEYEGKIYKTYTEIQLATRLSIYETYAYGVDKIDIISK